MKKNKKLIRETIEKYDLYQIDETGKTVLHLCAMENYKDLILHIFESFTDKAKKGEFINKRDLKGWSAIYYAIEISENGFPDMVELLLKHGADPSQADEKGITALHLSAYKGQDDNVEILLKYKADPNKKDIIGSKIINQKFF